MTYLTNKRHILNTYHRYRDQQTQRTTQQIYIYIQGKEKRHLTKVINFSSTVHLYQYAVMVYNKF